MEFGVVLPQVGGATWERTARTAAVAEEGGFDSLWLIDHLLGFPPEGGILEGWTVLAALAARTERVGLGVQVLCQSFRNPGLLAKMATTLHDVSGGRFRFLIGAGWYREEYDAFGYRFPLPGERFEQLRDTVRICRGMWESQGESFTYSGRHYSVDAVRNVPPPVAPIPIGIGGTGRRVLDLIAAEADEWNCPAAALPAYGRLRAELDGRLAHHGREVRRTVQIVFAPGRAQLPGRLGAFNPDLGLRGSTAEMVDRVGQLAADGITGLFGMVPDRAAMEAVAEALPELRKAAP